MWKCGNVERWKVRGCKCGNVEMWKGGKLEVANKNHDFSFLRYSLKFMVFFCFCWVSQCFRALLHRI